MSKENKTTEEYPRTKQAPRVPRVRRKQTYHLHKNEHGFMVKCYHGTRDLFTDYKFWIGITMSYPLEHWLWETLLPQLFMHGH